LANVKDCNKLKLMILQLSFPDIRVAQGYSSRSSQELVQKGPYIPGSNWNLEMLVFEERGKLEFQEKNLSEQSTEPTANSTLI